MMDSSKSESAPLCKQKRRDPRAIRSREALHSAFLELLELKPLDQITIRDIADRSGVGYTTFFRHHASKEDMLREIVTEQVSCLLELSLPKMDEGDLYSASTAIFSYVNDHRGLWSTLLNGGAAALVRDDFLRLGRGAAASRLPVGKWLPADIGLALIVSGTIELLSMWLRQTDPMPVKRSVEIYNRIVLSTIMEVNGFRMPQKYMDRGADVRTKTQRSHASRAASRAK
jgi:AcrR family transcriptional regulator